ncbi:unnamed protein product, partial [Prorocentrum cordatum]
MVLLVVAWLWAAAACRLASGPVGALALGWPVPWGEASRQDVDVPRVLRDLHYQECACDVRDATYVRGGHGLQPPQPPSNSAVRAQLQEAETLLSTAAAEAPPVGPPAAPPVATPLDAGVKNLKDLKKQLKDSTAVLPSLPEFEPARAAMQAQLDGVVARVRAAAPPGARLDGARAALDRALARRAAAAEAMAKAQAARAAAEAERVQLARDVEALKAAMAPAGTLAADPPSSQLQRLGAAAQDMLSELASAQGADPARVKVAETLSQQLAQGFQESLARAKLAARDAEMTAPRRMVGKQTPPSNEERTAAVELAVPTRLRGEQPKKVALQDFWPGAPVRVLESAVGKKVFGVAPSHEGAAALDGDVGLVLVSANVQTLKPHQEERSYSRNSIDSLLDKVEALEVQFDSHGRDIAGVQEGRSKSEGVFNGLLYRRYAAAATDDGALGVQLWIHRRVRGHVLHWRALTPRLLFGALRLNNGAVLVLTATRGAFWDELASTSHGLKERYARASLRVAVDASGRLGSALSRHIGHEDVAHEDENGARLRLHFDEIDLAAVSTFWPSGPTWCSTRGKWYRVDDVLSDSPELVTACRVDLDVDLTFN